VPALDAEEVPEPGWSQAKDVVLARESIERARTTLDSGEAATVKIMDDAIAALNSSIASVEAEGADPRKLTTVGGANLDLGAARQALLEQKAQELDRFARVRKELDAAVRITRDARAASR
jgi:L-alanine-DL-glutamate epimerase-like enolase superfamily enzyme